MVRRIIRIPKTSSESATPIRDIVKIMRNRAKNFLELQEDRTNLN